MKRFLIIGAMVLAVSAAQAQQDAQYSEYMFNHLAINPAYAGTRDALSLTVLSRKQWTFDGAPQTGSLSLHAPLRSKKIGLGLELITDRLGPKSMSGVATSYSYNIHFLRGRLSFGLKTGFYSYTIDWNKVIYKDNTDPYAQKLVEHKGAFSADFGMYYYTKSFYWGLSATHLNHDKYSVIGPDPQYQAMHFYSPIGFGFQAGENLIINPSLIVKYTMAAPVAVDVNCNFLIDSKLWLGVSLRKGYGVAALMMWNITDKLRLGLAYDHGMNKIGVLGKSTLEAVIGYDFNIFRPKTITPRYL